MATKKTRDLSDKAKEILNVLESNGTEMTLTDIKANGVVNPNGSHLKALETRGLVSSRLVEIVVETTRKVKAYSAVKPAKTETETESE